jgi:hypothetical protein
MNYSDFLQEQQKRKDEILSLRKSGKTYQEIGNLYSISRQRIHQIISGYRSYHQVENHIGKYDYMNDENWLSETAKFTNAELSEITGASVKLISSRRGSIRHKCNHSKESGFGKGILAEEWTSQHLTEAGIENQLQNFRADYDILALGNVRIDVKSSSPLNCTTTTSPMYSFQHRNLKNVDLYICIAWDTKDIFVFPREEMERTREFKRFVWPSKSDKVNKHNQQYHNRLDLIWQVHNEKDAKSGNLPQPQTDKETQ